jgi:hypothetical protein
LSSTVGSFRNAKAAGRPLALPGSSGGVVMLKKLRSFGLEVVGRLEWVSDRVWTAVVVDRVTKEAKGKRWIRNVGGQWLVTKEDPR